MRERFQRFLDRLESRLALFYTLSGLSVMGGGVTAWIASITQWLDQFGPIAWWGAGLLGTSLTALVIAVFVWIRHMWIVASAVRRWGKKVDAINPLDREFHKKRINFSDLAHPVTRRIEEKAFTDCDLLGPANIMLEGESVFFQIRFIECDFVPLSADSDGRVHNAVFLVSARIRGGTISRTTFLVPPEMAEHLHNMGVRFIGLTGDPNIDNQLPLSIGRRTQR